MKVKTSSIFVPPSDPDIDDYKDHFRIKNKAYQKHARLQSAGVLSRFSGSPDEWLDLWGYIPEPHPYQGGIYLPRNLGIDSIQVDAKTETIETTLAITPRWYQSEAVNVAKAKINGVVVMPCGAGKTTTGLALIDELKASTLILVHSRDLATQWIERIEDQLPGVSVGLVGAGADQRDRAVVVAIHKTLVMWDPWELHRWSKRFGLCLIDECHRAAEPQYFQVLSFVAAKYRIGLTATPGREDGRDELFDGLMGEIVYQVERSELVKSGDIRPAIVHVVKTGATVETHEAKTPDGWIKISQKQAAEYKRNGYRVKTTAPHFRTSKLSRNKDRNQLIFDIAQKEIQRGAIGMVLTNTTAHCDHIVQELLAMGIQARSTHGKRSKRDRALLYDSIREGRIQVIVGTTAPYSAVREGLDIKPLSFGILAIPVNQDAAVQQALGRIERPEGLEGHWYDLVDDFGTAKRNFSKRNSVYRNLGLEIK